ncbi:hypothetical protein PIB30_054521, partial [Stylosanthes scabra]|nr:hypothetical protein [Stylosanthes scabra]
GDKHLLEKVEVDSTSPLLSLLTDAKKPMLEEPENEASTLIFVHLAGGGFQVAFLSTLLAWLIGQCWLCEPNHTAFVHGHNNKQCSVVSGACKQIGHKADTTRNAEVTSRFTVGISEGYYRRILGGLFRQRFPINLTVISTEMLEGI